MNGQQQRNRIVIRSPALEIDIINFSLLYCEQAKHISALPEYTHSKIFISGSKQVHDLFIRRSPVWFVYIAGKLNVAGWLM